MFASSTGLPVNISISEEPNDNTEHSDSIQYRSAHNIFDCTVNNHLKDFVTDIAANEAYKSCNNCYCTPDEFNYRSRDFIHKIELSMCHLNIRSLNAKSDEFRTFVNLLEVEFDIIVLTELWNVNIEYYINLLPNYNLYTDLPLTNRVGGVGIFVEKNIEIKIRDDLNIPSSDLNKVENVWFQFIRNDIKYVVGGIYRHPNQDVGVFGTEFERCLHKLSKENISCLISGDFNINLMKFEECNHTSDYLNCVLLHNFLPMILLPTRITEKNKVIN